jgi:hypothetical protein
MIEALGLAALTLVVGLLAGLGLAQHSLRYAQGRRGNDA